MSASLSESFFNHKTGFSAATVSVGSGEVFQVPTDERFGAPVVSNEYSRDGQVKGDPSPLCYSRDRVSFITQMTSRYLVKLNHAKVVWLVYLTIT